MSFHAQIYVRFLQCNVINIEDVKGKNYFFMGDLNKDKRLEYNIINSPLLLKEGCSVKRNWVVDYLLI